MWASTNGRCPDVRFSGTGSSPWHILVGNPELRVPQSRGRHSHCSHVGEMYNTAALCILLALSQEGWINTRHQSGKQFSKTILKNVPKHLLNSLPPHVHFCNSSISRSLRNMTFLEQSWQCGLITVHWWWNSSSCPRILGTVHELTFI